MAQKKIAVVLYGLPRHSNLCIPSIEKSIIAPLEEKAKVRIFYCVYKQSFVNNPWSGEYSPLDEENYNCFSRFTGRIESDDEKCITELQKIRKFGDSWQNNFASTRNALRQLWANQAAYEIALAWEPDLYVFSRVDLLYHDAFDYNTITQKIQDDHTVLIPNWQWWDGLNDRFAVASPIAARAYGRRLDLAIEYCEETKLPFHAERFLKYALEKNNIAVKTVPWRASRTRVGGKIVNEDFTRDDLIRHELRRRLKKILFKMKLINAYGSSK